MFVLTWLPEMNNWIGAFKIFRQSDCVYMRALSQNCTPEKNCCQNTKENT